LTSHPTYFKLGDAALNPEVIAVTSETELWSLDPGNGRKIRVTLELSETPGFSDLDLRWNDGEPVTFPVKLTHADLQNLLDVELDHARKHGIKLNVPR
jgi:hypothetical protein